ncbi:MAG: OmpA family protein [Muribaculaceae bacterium]|nr:OmpA family protein [Muribaculaceae bacterium]
MSVRILLTALCVAIAGYCASAAGSADSFDPYTANIEENIATPSVPAKAHDAVAETMSALTRSLRKAGYTVEGVRGGEVTMVTIPVSALFQPNSTALKDNGYAKLQPLVAYVSQTGKYKTILAVHADDTGDETYAEELTTDRANAIDGYFADKLGGESPIIPYGLGFDEPVAPNTGVKNREKNRRIEFYFVPTAEYISTIRKK